MAEVKKVRFVPKEKQDKSLAVTQYKQNLKLQIPSDTSKSKSRGSGNALEDLVQCAICMDRISIPKMLSCQHTFCLHCLQSHLHPDANEIICPSCHKHTVLDEGVESVKHLPGNMYIDSILKLLSDESTPKTPTTKGPDTQCVKCQTKCQFFEHACRHCKQIFCAVCWSIHLSDLQTKLNELLGQLKESHSKLNHRIDSFRDRCVQLNDNIHSATEIQMNELKQRAAQCRNEARNIQENGLNSAEVLCNKIQDMERTIEEHEFDKIVDDSQKISYFMSLHSKTAALLDELSHWGDTRTIFNANAFKIESENDASLDAEVDDVDSNSTNVGNPLENVESLTMHYKTRSFAPKLTWSKCLRPAGVAIAPWTTNCIYIAGTDSRQIYGIDKLKGKLLFRISSPQMLCPVGITFSQQREEIFVSDKWKHCIHVFSKDGTYRKMLGKKGNGNGQFISPEGIAIGSNNNQLFICDTGNDRIQVMNALDGKFLYTFGITGVATGFLTDFKYTELNIPTGIAVTNDNIIVADSGNRRIKIYTLNGKKVSEFGSLGANRGQFRAPEVVAVDPMGFIIVGDSGNARVQIFRPDGSLVRIFRNKGKLAWVSGIHVTPQFEIIVTDYKTHSVHVF